MGTIVLVSSSGFVRLTTTSNVDTHNLGCARKALTPDSAGVAYAVEKAWRR
jgi:hypothetical protein